MRPLKPATFTNTSFCYSWTLSRYLMLSFPGQSGCLWPHNDPTKQQPRTTRRVAKTHIPQCDGSYSVITWSGWRKPRRTKKNMARYVGGSWGDDFGGCTCCLISLSGAVPCSLLPMCHEASICPLSHASTVAFQLWNQMNMNQSLWNHKPS